jgi:hypothetical protein
MIEVFITGIAIAIFVQWIIYPWFPEDRLLNNATAEKPEGKVQSNWIAIRSTIIVLPVYLLVLTNPLSYLAIIMKAVSLAQQSSSMNARDAGRELLGSTFLGGIFAIFCWLLLDLFTSLWMFTSVIILFSFYLIGKFYKVFTTRLPPTFWQNVMVTMLLLLGPAVEDSANGKDVYMAFAVRITLFIAVTIYACLAVYLLEFLREQRITRKNIKPETTKKERQEPISS